MIPLKPSYIFFMHIKGIIPYRLLFTLLLSFNNVSWRSYPKACMCFLRELWYYNIWRYHNLLSHFPQKLNTFTPTVFKTAHFTIPSDVCLSDPWKMVSCSLQLLTFLFCKLEASLCLTYVAYISRFVISLFFFSQIDVFYFI